MPLPFLTADRSFETAAESALPHDDPDRWRRPYRPGPWRVGVAALWLLLASFMLFGTVLTALTGSVPSATAVLVVGLLIIASALRLLRMGVWVSRRGLRRTGFLRTRTLPWERVVSVRTVQRPVRWLGLPRTVQGQALALVRTDLPPDDTPPLLTTHTLDFLGRPMAFDRAADTVEAWAAECGRG
ncbi:MULTISPECIES: phage holin family protein [Streptomyces]|uniref:Phage holin family protein n=1 Tax=Streptomyces lavenduligriseus TaxID=67315 RepID=A0ABT0NWE8_9ACTN|nr:phage holin family protein [Streptomyces lavenduligriseus]MCL3995772.1 phage holin family protein [Streptomyces lavenduligriseus]